MFILIIYKLKFRKLIILTSRKYVRLSFRHTRRPSSAGETQVASPALCVPNSMIHLLQFATTRKS